MRIFQFLSIVISILFWAQSSYAVVSIDITRGNVDPMPVALPDFGAETDKATKIGKDIINVIQNDLESTGLFKSINKNAFLQEVNSSNTVPRFIDWRQINASVLLAGGIQMTSDSEFSTQFRLWDVFAEQQIAGKSYQTNINNWRRIAHLIADEIYKRLTGEQGYFDTRIVYISEKGPVLKRIKRLAIMDQDGANHRYLTDGKNLVLTPRFSPTAQKVIYMSYAGGVPKVYMLDVDTKESELIGDFEGMSFSPRFAPDGKSVVMSVSLNGNSEIYTMDLRTKSKSRITRNRAIDTSPSFSPDSKKIVYNSDRGGTQQIYVMDARGNKSKRISFGRGRYGTPVWSPRGDLIAFTKMYKGKFYIGVMRPDGSGERLLTESFLDEGPTWSPNGRVIMYSRQSRTFFGKPGKWEVRSIDLTGYNDRKISTPEDASDPAWSSLL